MTLARDLDRFDRNAVTHLRLAMLGVVLRAIELVEDREAIVEAHPFVAEYLGDFAQLTSQPIPTAADWQTALTRWSEGHENLPLRRLESAGLDQLALDVLLTLGFAEEDPRFAALFGDSSRLTLGALLAMCRGRDVEGGTTVASAVARLSDLGIVKLDEQSGARHSWEYAVTPSVWDALAGVFRPPAGLNLEPCQALPDVADFVPPREPFPSPGEIAELVATHNPILCLRGRTRNGRHTLAGCVMKALGRPLLSADAAMLDKPMDWALAGVLACLTDAGIAIELSLGPGQDRIVPAFPFGEPILMVIAGASGGIQSADGRPVFPIDLPLPDAAARALIWRRRCNVDNETAAEFAERFRLTSGNLVRATEAIAIRTRLADSKRIAVTDVREAIRGLHDSRLEAVARRVELGENCDFISLDELALDELAMLSSRCRHREELSREGASSFLAGQAGVRALFAGPSGTGKTLAAQWLAQRLGKDLYRLDLAASVSKYIGETEKILDRAFAAAEDLDCVLLIDEGDALMARRTDVGNANDRYANLETNFLLQRIEAFEGILLVTTNAAERIDKAFGRRMDVVVQFRAPDEMRRYAILDRHLGDHAASDRLLQEIACRCALTGGQIKNIAQHARLLALDRKGPLRDDELRAALIREYRKIDAHCPLKPQLAAAG
ncbi:MAG TPA: ATP-binding protein [Sphingomicrobium sp.]|nr:ATP-binding protein [Sphingomicrobium sp.]